MCHFDQHWEVFEKGELLIERDRTFWKDPEERLEDWRHYHPNEKLPILQDYKPNTRKLGIVVWLRHGPVIM